MSKKKSPATSAAPASRPKIDKSAPSSTSAAWSKWPWIVLTISLLFLVGVRLRLLAIPLERDEGGFAYIGKMIFEGQKLYTDLLDSKLPGLYVLYGIFVKIFGYTPSGVHAGLLVCNLAAAVLLFFLAKKIFNVEVGALAVAVFSVMSTSLNLYGFAAHATQLLLPFALGGLLVLAYELPRSPIRSTRVLLAGVLLSVAFLVKQQAVFFMPLGALYVWASMHEHSGGRRSWGAGFLMVFWLALGSVLPYLLVFLYMLADGRGDAFWFWTYDLPQNLGVSHASSEKLTLFKQMSGIVFRGQWGLWVLAAVGVAMVWIRSTFGFTQKVFATAFPLLTFGGVLMGAAFYPHYWVLVLPGVALLTGLAAYRVGTAFSPGIAALLFGLAIGQAVFSNSTYFFTDSHKTILRKAYLFNPFPECVVVGEEIRKRSKPGDEIAVLGAEPELLMYTGLPSISGHIFPYHLVDGQPYNLGFQKEVVESMLQRKPRFAVVFTSGTSWLATDVKRTNDFLNRLSQPLFNNPAYRRIGVVDIFNNKQVFKWDQELAGFQPESQIQIWVYMREH